MRLRVLEWKEGKTRNIRALLCSLNVIIWEGCNWNPIGMHQLVAANDVKKMYRKACLAVHPDKVSLIPSSMKLILNLSHCLLPTN